MELLSHIQRFFYTEHGAALAEYGLLATLIAIAAIVAVTVFGGGVLALFNTALDAF